MPATLEVPDLPGPDVNPFDGDGINVGVDLPGRGEGIPYVPDPADAAAAAGDIAGRVLTGAAGIVSGPLAELALGVVLAAGAAALILLGLKTILLRTETAQAVAGARTRGAT